MNSDNFINELGVVKGTKPPKTGRRKSTPDESVSGSGTRSSDWADYVLKRSSKPKSPNADESVMILKEQAEIDEIPTIPDTDEIDGAVDDAGARVPSAGAANRANMYQEINKELKRTSNVTGKTENLAILMESFTADEYLKKFDEDIGNPWSMEELCAEFGEDYYRIHGVAA